MSERIGYSVFYYRKKPVAIQAMQLTWDNTEEAISWVGGHARRCEQLSGAIIIKTLEGEMTALVSDYIIKGTAGEFYPCKPHIFAQSYDRILKGA